MLLADIADIPLRRSHFCAWSECAIDVAEKSIRGIPSFKRPWALSNVFQMACSFVSWQHSLAGSDIFQMFSVGCGGVGSAFSVWVAVALFVYDFGIHDLILHILIDNLWIQVYNREKDILKGAENMKTLLVGNGIDIQYGGYAQRSNKAILERVLKNIEKNKYTELEWGSDSIKKIFEYSLDIVNSVIEGTWGGNTKEYYYFLVRELYRLCRTYSAKCDFTSLGLEDYFLGIELASLEAKPEERDRLRDAGFFYMQPIILDAIYDDGRVNEIYRNFPQRLISMLKRYDRIFTLNYDTNIDKCVNGSVPVYHLHGCFDHKKSNVIDVPDKFKHMFSNGIMSWYWLEKYGDEEKDPRYGIKEFNQIEGNIDVIGISPCNDEQLFVRLSLNHKITSCNYFYYDDAEQQEIKHHFDRRLLNHTTIRSVKKLWDSFCD